MINKLSKYIFFVACLYCFPAFGQASISDTLSGEEEVPSRIKTSNLYFDAQKAKMLKDNRLAIELFEKYVAKDPTNSAAFYELSQLCEDKKHLDKAELYIKKATAIIPDNKWYNEQLAEVLAEQGKYDEAASVAMKLADAEKSDISYAVVASEYLLRAQKYKESIQYIDKAIVRSGDDEDMMLKKVDICLKAGNIDQAAQVINTLIERDRHNGKYYKLLSELYDNNKKSDKARDVLLKGEKEAPGDLSIQVGLADYYLKHNDTTNFRRYAKQAMLNADLDLDAQMELFQLYTMGMKDSEENAEGLPILQALVAQHPNDAKLVATYGGFLESIGNVKEAIVQYKTSLAMAPGNFSVWERLLNAYTDKKDADSLLKYSDKVIRLFPTQAVAHYFNGIAKHNKGDNKAAALALQRAADMAPETNKKMMSAIYSTLGMVFIANKQLNEGWEAYDKALSYDQDNASALNNYSYALAQAGTQLAKAEQMSLKSLKLRPDEPTFLDTYGWVLYKKGDYAKAKEQIEKAIKLSENMAEGSLYEHLGDVFYKLNNKQKALEMWKMAKEKGGATDLLLKKITEEKLYE